MVVQQLLPSLEELCSPQVSQETLKASEGLPLTLGVHPGTLWLFLRSLEPCPPVLPSATP